MKKAIVFGASGLVGSQLVDLLTDDINYDKIVLFNRRPLSLNSSKIEEHIVNFDEMEKFSDKISEGTVFCSLGSTIRKAKTIENFIKVDYEIPFKIAKAAKQNNIESFILVSSIGANSKSRNYYTKTKGKIEEELLHLSFNHVKILRPSMLLGQRKEFRLFELIGKIIMQILGFLFIGKLKRYKGIQARNVAKAMIWLSVNKTDQVIFESDEINELCKKFSL